MDLNSILDTGDVCLFKIGTDPKLKKYEFRYVSHDFDGGPKYIKLARYNWFGGIVIEYFKLEDVQLIKLLGIKWYTKLR